MEGFDFIQLLTAFAIDIVSITLFCYYVFQRRHDDRESYTAYTLFNIFVFVVITIFLNVQAAFDIGFAFGLFAILSLITLRSETLKKTDITYFFGALSIALINALGLDNYVLLIFANAVIVLAAWILDRPNVPNRTSRMVIVLDFIPDGILENREAIIAMLSKQFNTTVLSYKVIQIDYVKDIARIRIKFQKNAKTQQLRDQ